MEEKDIPGQKAESPDEALNAAGKEAAAMKDTSDYSAEFQGA